MSDSEVVRSVASWSVGFLVLVVAGVAVPMLVSFLPDAVARGRERGTWRPVGQLLAVLVVLTAVGVYQCTHLGAPGSPSLAVWMTLTLLLAFVTGSAAIGNTALRMWRRRMTRREAVTAVMRSPKPAHDQAETAERRPPGAVTRMNARQAELLACEWMRYLGALDAIVTPAQRDGGVDVRSRDFVAQVKHRRGEAIGVEPVRQLHGVAAAEGRRALFFSSSGYTREAVAFASEVAMALFIVRATEGRLVAHGPLAQRYLEQGLLLSSQR